MQFTDVEEYTLHITSDIHKANCSRDAAAAEAEYHKYGQAEEINNLDSMVRSFKLL
jgi:hypothetical protein